MEDNLLDLYSRQIGAYGLETMIKLTNLKLIVSGLDGLGAEIVKNLVLAGVKEVMLHDHLITKAYDLGTNFALKESDVGHVTRAQGTATMMKEINSNVVVTICEGEITKEILQKCDAIAVCNYTKDMIIYINDMCRELKKGFLSVANFGLCGYIFVDFLSNFIVHDPSGETMKNHVIETIVISRNLLTVFCASERLKNIYSNDYVSFNSIVGSISDTLKNKLEKNTFKVISVEKNTLTLNIDEDDGTYQISGNVKVELLPIKIDFESYKNLMYKPIKDDQHELQTIDLNYVQRAEQLHLIIQALLEYQTINHTLPEPHSNSAILEIYKIATSLNENMKKNNVKGTVSKIDKNLLDSCIKFASCLLSPCTSILGGIASQELLKLTGKYIPINQWLYFDCVNLITDIDYSKHDMSTVNKCGRYQDIETIFTKDIVNLLQTANIFLVGAGALGCEYLKGLAMLGISTKGNHITVTDMDTIEVSNLNRQFLFRPKHVGQSKSQIAKASILKMNKDIRIDAKEERVGLQSEDIFDDIFWSRIDCVLNGLDNIESRLYIDEQCVNNNKPLVESGTLGPTGNVQVIIPNLTESYADSRDPVEESIPLCTLRHFPNQIEHTMEWARDLFEKLFSNYITDTQQILTDENYLETQLVDKHTTSQLVEMLTIIADIVKILYSDSNDHVLNAIQAAVNLFVKFFNHDIRQLLHNFPPDYLTTSGTKFWSGTKRIPKPIEFDINDDLILKLLVSYSNIMLKICGKTDIVTNDIVRKYENDLKIKEYKQTTVIIKTTTENNEDKDADESDPSAKLLLTKENKNLINCIKEYKNRKEQNVSLTPEVFKKDNDQNYHIAFINSCGNLRARNYNIAEITELQSKLIAGKIIPALSTTTAVITGFGLIELLKVLINKHNKPNITLYRNTYATLIDSSFILSEPVPAKIITSVEFDNITLGPIRAKPEKFTKWDKVEVEINRSQTVADLIDIIEKKFDTTVTSISLGNIAIYMQLTSSGFERKNKKISDLLLELSQSNIEYQHIQKKKHLLLDLYCCDNDYTDTIIPTIKCKLIE